jgi:protocatechuate 3,4-dioxygenase beta subunit
MACLHKALFVSGNTITYFIIKITNMKRRDFLINTGLSVVAISASSFIKFDGKQFIGDCETTSDILGPYYRPNSPVRNNLVIKGEKGTLIELSGIIKHKDCVTPYNNAKVELWHCNNQGQYDNTSNEYRYRGTTYSDDKGNYSFNTIIPVPYGSGNDIRPAHFHLMITAEGYQPLVTQLYFSGDKYIAKDPAASSLTSKRRILKTQNLKDGTKKIIYDVSMSLTLTAEAVAIDKLIGVYTNIKDAKDKKELFKKDNDLWLKNEVFGENYRYIGNNTFEYPGEPAGSHASLQFELLSAGDIKLTITDVWGATVNPVGVYLKDK